MEVSPALRALIARKIREIRLEMEEREREIIVISDEEEERDDDVVEVIVIDSDDDEPMDLLEGIRDLLC